MSLEFQSFIRSLVLDVLKNKSIFSEEEIEKTLDHMSDWIGDIALNLHFSDSKKSDWDDTVKKITSIIVPDSSPQTRIRYTQMRSLQDYVIPH